MTPEESKLYADSLKSRDTEEWIDLLFYRPIGFRWALFFRKLGVTPNAVTIASIILGVLAGILFYPQSLPINIIGMLLLVWANSYDSADGQLARLTGQKSELGRILDGVAGDCWFISIYLAIAFRLMPQWSFWIFILGSVAGYCHSKQAMMADYYRNIHLFFLKGKQGSELDNAVQQREIYRQLSWKNDFVKKLFQFFYKDYTANQERLSPCFQRFFVVLKEKYADGVAPVEIREAFRQKSLPLMKFTNILSFNTRVIALFISLLINLPWLYFVFELTILNALLLYMIHQHEKLSREMLELINQENEDSQQPNNLPLLVSCSSPTTGNKKVGWEPIRVGTYVNAQSVKALAFDFGGTLDSPFLHWMQVYLKIYNEQLHLNLTPETFRDSYVFAEREMERLQLVKPTDGFLQTQLYKTHLQFDHLCSKGVISVGTIRCHELAEDAARLVTDYANFYLQANKPILESLSKHYPLLLVSNYYGNLRAIVEEAGLLPFFKSITDSTVVGIRKPDPTIWQHAFDANGLKPEEVVVIGDSTKNDILPALSLGCKVIKCCAIDEDLPDNIPCIHNLQELLIY